MDQEKEIEKTPATDSAVLKEDVPSAIATANTSGKQETVEESSDDPNKAPSSADKAMEQPPSDKPQDQPTAVETPNQPSDEVHSTEKPSSKKQPSSENTPDTGKTENQIQDDQTANQESKTFDDKSGKHVQPLGDESSTKETDLNPAPITQRAEEQKLTGEKSAEGLLSVTSEQDPNANDQVSNSKTGTPPEQLKSGVQEVPIVDEPSTNVTKDEDSNDKTGEQSTKQNVKEIGESSVKVEDSADAEPLTEVPSKQPLKSGKDLQIFGDESSTKETDLNPAPITQRTEEQKPTGEKSEERLHSVTSEQDPNANDQVSSSKTGTPPEQLKSGVQEVPIADEPSTKVTKEDSAKSNSADSNDKTEENSTTLNVKEIREGDVKVEDSLDAEPLTEVTSKQPESNLDNLQKSLSSEDTIAKQQVLTDHQPTVESFSNKEEDDTNKVKKGEMLSPEKDAVQEESPVEKGPVEKGPVEKDPVESKIETKDKMTEAEDEEQAATPKKQDTHDQSSKGGIFEKVDDHTCDADTAGDIGNDADMKDTLMQKGNVEEHQSPDEEYCHGYTSASRKSSPDKAPDEENPQGDTAASIRSPPHQQVREGSFYQVLWDAILDPENCPLILMCVFALWLIFWASSLGSVFYALVFYVLVIMMHVLLRIWIKGTL